MSEELNITTSFRVAVIGRPNVGKSTLFNVLTRSRKAVVKNQPGITRDIIFGQADWWGKEFEVLDTGGLTEGTENFSAEIYDQVLNVLKSVNLLIVVMDGKSGLVPEDRDVIRVAKESGRPFFIVVNKVDRERDAEVIKAEFYEFGMEVLHASFEKRDGVDRVVEQILGYIKDTDVKPSTGVRVAIVGKPNVGKSSLVNALLNEKRMIVSNIAGTTVDAVESAFRYKNQDFVIVDTAGLRRQARRWSKKDGVEILSSFKSYDAIDRSDLVLLMIDATEGPTDQDAKIAAYVFEKAKPLIIVANKFDLAREQLDEPRHWFRERIEREFHFAPDIPISFISAERRQGIEGLLDTVIEVWSKMEIHISTSELNDFFYNVIRQAPSPVYQTTNVKFYYLTQTQQKPPSFIAFANHPEGVTPSYRRFLVNRIQSQWGLEGLPVRVFIMKSGGS